MFQIDVHQSGNSTLVSSFIPVGSRHEPNNIKGISHLLEHMMFKGTTNRNKNVLKLDMDKYGAQFNAWTSEEHTCYHGLISNKYINYAREIINDIVSNSIFPDDELEKEKQVVLQELEMYEDNPQSSVFQDAQKAVFSVNSGLHLPIIGTRETVLSITRDMLMDYYKTHYKIPIQLNIGSIPSERNKAWLKPDFDQEPLNYNLDDLIIPRSGIHQANMVLTGLLHLNTVEDRFLFEIYSAIMNGFSGRFFDEIREKHNLVYRTGLYSEEYSCGTVQYFGYAGLSTKNINMAVELMKDQLLKPITEEELQFAKMKWLGNHELQLDLKNIVAKIIIDCTLSNQDYDVWLQNYVFHINKITTQDINNFIMRCNLHLTKLVAIIPDNERPN